MEKDNTRFAPQPSQNNELNAKSETKQQRLDRTQLEQTLPGPTEFKNYSYEKEELVIYVKVP